MVVRLHFSASLVRDISLSAFLDVHETKQTLEKTYVEHSVQCVCVPYSEAID